MKVENFQLLKDVIKKGGWSIIAQGKIFEIQ